MNSEMDLMILNKVKGIQGTVDNIGEKTALESSVQEVKNIVQNQALESTSQEILNSISSFSSAGIIPRYRPDDYLTIVSRGVQHLLSSEKTVVYNSSSKNVIVLGRVTLPSDCVKISLTARIKQSSGTGGLQLQVGRTFNSNFSSIYTSNYINGVNTTYKTFTVEHFIHPNVYDSFDIGLYVGMNVTGYCNDLKVTCYGVDRVITTELYETGTIKSYGVVNGSSFPYFSECPRMDRVEIISSNNPTFIDYMSSNAYVFDGVPYLLKLHTNGSCSYMIRY